MYVDEYFECVCEHVNVLHASLFALRTAQHSTA